MTDPRSSAMNRACFAIASGSYSDYVIHCVCEREEDALAYVRAYNERALRAEHDKNIASDYTPPNPEFKCSDPIETCPGCGRYYANLEQWALRVEKIDFIAAGGLPVVQPQDIRG